MWHDCLYQLMVRYRKKLTGHLRSGHNGGIKDVYWFSAEIKSDIERDCGLAGLLVRSVCLYTWRMRLKLSFLGESVSWEMRGTQREKSPKAKLNIQTEHLLYLASYPVCSFLILAPSVPPAWNAWSNDHLSAVPVVCREIVMIPTEIAELELLKIKQHICVIFSNQFILAWKSQALLPILNSFIASAEFPMFSSCLCGVSSSLSLVWCPTQGFIPTLCPVFTEHWTG